MRYITVDSQAIRFHYYGGQTNCFWRDVIRWPRRRFLHSLKSGLQKWIAAKEGTRNVVN